MWQQKDVTLTDGHRTTPLCGRVCWRWKLGERGKSKVRGWEVDVTSELQYPQSLHSCFLKWWYPQNTPKWSFLVGKPMVVGYHHFRNPPHVATKNCRKTSCVKRSFCQGKNLRPSTSVPSKHPKKVTLQLPTMCWISGNSTNTRSSHLLYCSYPQHHKILMDISTVLSSKPCLQLKNWTFIWVFQPIWYCSSNTFLEYSNSSLANYH